MPQYSENYSQAAAPKVQPYVLGKLVWSFKAQVDS